MNTSRLIRSVKPRVLARFMGHDHHHTPNLPPFARLKPATQSVSFITNNFLIFPLSYASNL